MTLKINEYTYSKTARSLPTRVAFPVAKRRPTKSFAHTGESSKIKKREITTLDRRRL